MAEAERLRDAYVARFNEPTTGIGGAILFCDFVKIYVRDVLSTLAAPTQDRSESALRVHLVPEFGNMMLREITLERIQYYFARLQQTALGGESVDKLKDVLSAVLRTAVDYGRLLSNPAQKIRLKKRKLNRAKPFLRTHQFFALVELIEEPYATMTFVAVFTGLRPSELCGLRWHNLGAASITVEERYCRGDWDVPKTLASNATISVDEQVIERIERLKTLEVEIRAGRTKRRYRVVKGSGPRDLVFQSKTGGPLCASTVLVRHVKPAARKLGFDWVNWQVLRRSCATWLQQAGVDVKDAQGILRHSRASTTQDIYQQVVPEAQSRAVGRFTAFVQQAAPKVAAAGNDEEKALNECSVGG